MLNRLVQGAEGHAACALLKLDAEPFDRGTPCSEGKLKPVRLRLEAGKHRIGIGFGRASIRRQVGWRRPRRRAFPSRAARLFLSGDNVEIVTAPLDPRRARVASPGPESSACRGIGADAGVPSMLWRATRSAMFQKIRSKCSVRNELRNRLWNGGSPVICNNSCTVCIRTAQNIE